MHIRMKKFMPGENTLMVLIASFIGAGAGLVSILFRIVLELVHKIIFVNGYSYVQQGGWHILLLPLVPMCGMILLIPLSLMFPGEINGYGLPKFLRKVNMEGGYIPFRTIILKILSCSLTIGTGNSAGVEGPIALVGGALGSQCGKFSRVSGERMKIYIAAGSAGAIAAVFNAPIAGVFFAAEIVLLGTYEISSFSALVVSSAIATVVSRAYYGESPVFQIPPYHLVSSFTELPLYMLMGLFMGVLAVLHIRFFYKTRDFFANCNIHPQAKPIVGAFLVGLIAIFFPRVMGDGYDYIKVVLAGHAVLWVMAVLIFLKIAATSITLGAGGSGGVFAPALFIGAVAGGAFGGVVHHLFPLHTAAAGAYAAVGVGAFLAASTHSPLTAIFLLFEMTGDYRIIIPVMLSSIIGTTVAHWLCKDSIDTVDFSREGIDIHEGRETAIMKSIKVGTLLDEDVNFISETANVDQLLKIFSMAKDGFYFPVINETGMMTGIVSLQDVKTVLHDEKLRRNATVGKVCARNVIFVTPEENLYDAMRIFDIKGFDEIPVVEDKNSPWVLGMLKRRDILEAYHREVIKRGISAKSCPIRFD